MKKIIILITALFISSPLCSFVPSDTPQIIPQISPTTEVELKITFPDSRQTEEQVSCFSAFIYDDAGQHHIVCFKAVQQDDARSWRIISATTLQGEPLINPDELPSFTFDETGSISSIGDVNTADAPADFTLTFDFSATGGSAAHLVTFKCGTIGQTDGFVQSPNRETCEIISVRGNGGPVFPAN